MRGATIYEWRASCAYEIGSRSFEASERNTYEVGDDRRAEASFDGEEVHRIRLEGGRTLRLKTRFTMRSDVTHFGATFTRRLFENDVYYASLAWNHVARSTGARGSRHPSTRRRRARARDASGPTRAAGSG